MKRKTLLFFSLLIGVPTLCVACNDNNEKSDTGSSDDTSDGGTQTDIEIFTWWVNPGEADALQMIVIAYKNKYPNVGVIDLSSVFGDSHDALVSITERIENGNPPEIYQANPANAELFIAGEGNGETQLQVLDDLFETEEWGAQFRPEFVEAATADDGHIYSLPISVIRINTMFYNKRYVSEPPQTIDELLEMCEELSKQGITPVAVSEVSWVLGYVLKPMLAASAGFEFFRAFFEDELDFEDEQQVKQLEGALQDFVDLMAYSNTNAAELEWQDAADLLRNGDAAFYFHPSWAKGYLTSLGWQAGKDFGIAPMPGTQGVFIYTFDGFVSFEDSKNASNGLDFLRVAGALEAQSEFNKIKGQLPTLEGISMSQWDDLAIQSYQDLETASHLFYSDNNLGVGLDQYAQPLYRKKISVEETAQRIIQNYTFDPTSK